VKLITHLHLVPGSRTLGAILPLPPTPSWRGAQLKHRDNFTFTRYVSLDSELVSERRGYYPPAQTPIWRTSPLPPNRVIHPLQELPSLRHKSLMCSVFCIRVPSRSQRVPALRRWRFTLTATVSYALLRSYGSNVMDRIFWQSCY